MCIRDRNSIILRGGSESINSNLALSSIIKESLRDCKMPINLVQLINTTDRSAVSELLKLEQYVDVKEAKLSNGLLTVSLLREVPEERKPRQIALKTA